MSLKNRQSWRRFFGGRNQESYDLKRGIKILDFSIKWLMLIEGGIFLEKLRVNDVCLEGENNIKEGMAGAFQMFLSETGEWRSSVEGLAFNSLSPADSVALEVPFFEEEVFSALFSLSGDKASGPNGFTLAFW